MNKAQERLTIFLATNGLDPEEILAEGWDERGYLTLMRDSEGKFYVDPTNNDSMRAEWRSWPQGFKFTKFCILATRAGYKLPSKVREDLRDSLGLY